MNLVETRPRVSVTGMGRSAAPRYLRSITQADPSTTRKHGGTRLGLASDSTLLRATASSSTAAPAPYHISKAVGGPTLAATLARWLTVAS